MKPEAQRIAIALACGWKWEDEYNKRKQKNTLIPPIFTGPFGTVTVWRGGGFGGESNLPNYPNDLNAMLDAFITLSPTNRIHFCDHLESVITGNAQYYRSDDHPLVVNATASQRAEAFLKTIGKWEESK